MLYWFRVVVCFLMILFGVVDFVLFIWFDFLLVFMVLFRMICEALNVDLFGGCFVCCFALVLLNGLILFVIDLL